MGMRWGCLFGCGFLILLWPWLVYGDSVGVPGKSVPAERVIELKKGDREALSVLGSGVVGKALPAWPLTDTADLEMSIPGRWMYRLVASASNGALQVDRVRRLEPEGAGLFWRREVGRKFIEFFRMHPNGRVDLVSDVSFEDGVIVRYRPTCPLMFNGMEPGAENRVETDVTVYDLHKPTREKYTGRLTVVHTYVGVYEITVPAGKFQAVLMKSSYDGKVWLASVHDKGYIFYAERVGVVAAVQRMHISAFLFYNKQEVCAKILIDQPDLP